MLERTCGKHAQNYEKIKNAMQAILFVVWVIALPVTGTQTDEMKKLFIRLRLCCRLDPKNKVIVMLST